MHRKKRDKKMKDKIQGKRGRESEMQRGHERKRSERGVVDKPISTMTSNVPCTCLHFLEGLPNPTHICAHKALRVPSIL